MSEDKADAEIDEMTKTVEMVDIGGDGFSMEKLTEEFKKCQENPDISVQEYITGYKELYKFLCLMGTVFGWVGSDVYNKVELLEKYLTGDKKEHYQTVKSMIAYEVGNNVAWNDRIFKYYFSRWKII